MPVICECTAPFLPKVRQEAVQNQRQKDRKIAGKRELRVVLRAASRGGRKFIPRLSGVYNRDSCMGWNSRSHSAPVTVGPPPFWAYECPASPGSSGADTTFFSCFGSHTEGIYIPCTVYGKISKAASLCFGGEPALPVAVWGTEAPTLRFETATSPGDKRVCIRLICM